MDNHTEYYLEYSGIQQCFHLGTLDDIKETNINLMKRAICNGYTIIGGPGTMKEMLDLSQHIEKTIGRIRCWKEDV